MKKVLLLVVGMMVTCMFASDSIIDFDATTLTGWDVYSVAREYDVDTTSMMRMPFTLRTPIFLDTPLMSIYGGVIVSNATTTLYQSSTYYQINAGGEDLRLSSSSTGGSQNTIFLAQGFKKRFFTGLKSMRDTYSFDSSSELNVLFKQWSSGGTVTNDARFLVQNGDKYYISEYCKDPNSTKALSLTDFNNNSTVGKRWYEYDMDPDAFRIPENMTFAPVEFDDVNYVGFIAQGARGYATTYSWVSFSATANRTADPNFGPPSVETEWLIDNIIDNYADATITMISTGAAPSKLYCYYGKSDGGTTSWESSVDLGYKDPGSYTAHMTDLDYNTTYYYCAMASNSYGTTWGDVSTFTSAGMPIVAYIGAEMVSPIPDSSRVAWDESHTIYGNPNGTNVIYFTDDLIFSNAQYSQAQVSGAYRVLEGAGGSFNNSASYYSSKFSSFCSGTSSNDSYYAASQGVFFWDKNLFLNGLDAKTVSMGKGDQLSAYITTDYQGLGEGLCFVIKNDGVYYFSESRFTAKGDCVIESVGQEKWGVWDPTANPSSFAEGDVLPPVTATFETREFDDVEAVGVSFDFRRSQWSFEFGFNKFMATTSSDKGTILIIQ